MSFIRNLLHRSNSQVEPTTPITSVSNGLSTDSNNPSNAILGGTLTQDTHISGENTLAIDNLKLPNLSNTDLSKFITTNGTGNLVLSSLPAASPLNIITPTNPGYYAISDIGVVYVLGTSANNGMGLDSNTQVEGWYCDIIASGPEVSVGSPYTNIQVPGYSAPTVIIDGYGTLRLVYTGGKYLAISASGPWHG